jgi:hypothetical protein
MDYGHSENRNVQPESWDGSWFCGDNDSTQCMCNGEMWYGLLERPDTGTRINSLDEMKEFKT